MKKIKLSSALLMLLFQIPLMLQAQHDLTLYQMQYVPQRLSVNPAFIPREGACLGVPLLSGIKFDFREPVRYNQIFTKTEGDTLMLNPEKFLDKFSKNNRVHLNFDMQLFSFGTKIAKGKFFINFSVSEKMTHDVKLPENLFSFLWYGNGNSRFLGKYTRFSPSMSASVYNEWAATFAGKAFKDKLTYGISVKYLSGQFNIKTKKANFDFYTDTAFYNIYMKSDMEIQTSGVNGEYFDRPFSSILFGGNNGIAFDIGATYRINDKFGVSASMTDLGFITWKNRTMTFVSKEPGKEFRYTGMSISDFMDMFTDLSSFGKRVSDSIFDLIKIDSVKDVKYSAGIPVRFNVGGSYQINEKSSVNLLLNGVSCNQHFYPAVSAAYSFNWTKSVAFNVSYSIFNRQYTNVGLGITLNMGSTQLYLVTDNLPSYFFRRGTNNASFQFGFNILFGRNKTIAEPEPSEDSEN